MKKINKMKDNTESVTWKDIDSSVNEDEVFLDNPVLETEPGNIYPFKNGFFFFLFCVFEQEQFTIYPTIEEAEQALTAYCENCGVNGSNPDFSCWRGMKDTNS